MVVFSRSSTGPSGYWEGVFCACKSHLQGKMHQEWSSAEASLGLNVQVEQDRSCSGNGITAPSTRVAYKRAKSQLEDFRREHLEDREVKCYGGC